MKPVALYTRVSTNEQTCENQLLELRQYVGARGWTAIEYVDQGVSGSKDRRPALDEMLNAARRRKIGAVLVFRLDRLGRNLRHLLSVIEELDGLGVTFISLGEGIDLATPAGRLQLHVLAALSEFEKGRIQERVRAGLARARSQGKRLGRPRVHSPRSGPQVTVRDAAKAWGVSKSTAARRMAVGEAPAVG